MIEFAEKDTERVEQHVQRHPCLQEMINTEPEVLTLLKLAASQQSRANRWYIYETLKRVGSQYVGWEARNPGMCSSRYYEEYIRAIDLLIPAPEIENESEDDIPMQDALSRLRDAVLGYYPQASLPPFLN